MTNNSKVQTIGKKHLKNVVYNNFVPCAYCGKHFMHENELSIDHILPVSRGGAGVLHNYVVCCKTCNSKKSSHKFHKWIRKIDICCFINYLTELNNYLPKSKYFYQLFCNDSIPDEIKEIMEYAV